MQPDIKVTQLWIAMNLSTRKIYRSIDTTMKKEGLPSLKWYDVLWELERNEQGLRPHELTERLLFEQSNLSKLLKRIHQEGLIKEVTLKDDRRGKVIQITQSGRNIRRKMWKIYGTLIHEHIGEFVNEEQCEKATGTLMSLL